jgi:hypothetical protein
MTEEYFPLKRTSAETHAHAAANDLAAELREKPWYHRTTVVWTESGGYHLEVYGERVRGLVPADCPDMYRGLHVVFNRVTPSAECPFGSVKARTRTKAEQGKRGRKRNGGG